MRLKDVQPNTMVKIGKRWWLYEDIDDCYQTTDLSTGQIKTRQAKTVVSENMAVRYYLLKYYDKLI